MILTTYLIMIPVLLDMINYGAIESINTNNLFKQIKRNDYTYHSVYLKDSTGKEYLVWIKITGILSN